MPAITTKDLTRRFGTFAAVDGVSIDVEYGDVFGFLGPDGSGKTTVMKMLTGILPVSGGAAWVDGLDVRKDGEELRRRIGSCPRSSASTRTSPCLRTSSFTRGSTD